MKNLFLPFALLFLTGCIAMSVPRTTITGTVAGKPFKFEGPKDVDLSSLTITATAAGDLTLTITGLKSVMNPEVITTTGDAQVKLVQAGADAVVKTLGAIPK